MVDEPKRGPHGGNCTCPLEDYVGLGCCNPAAPLDLVTDTPIEKYLIKTDTSIGFGTTNPPPRSIVFNDNKLGEIGRLTWEEDGIMTFTGNTDASAKLFFDVVCGYFNMNEKENPNEQEV